MKERKEGAKQTEEGREREGWRREKVLICYMYLPLPVLVVECVYVASKEDWLHTDCNIDDHALEGKECGNGCTCSNTHSIIT